MELDGMLVNQRLILLQVVIQILTIMKKLMLLPVAAAMLLASCGTSNEYSVAMTLPDNSLDGDTVYLTNYDNGDTIATGIVAGTTLKFTGTTDKDLLGSVVVGGGRQIFVVEPGEITIDSVNKVTGTPLNAVLDSLDSSLSAVMNNAGSLYEKYSTGEIDSLAFTQEMDSLQNSLLGELKSFYQANKDKSVAIIAFMQYMQYAELGLDEIEAEVAASPALASSKRVAKVVEAMRNKERTAEGAMFADFTVTDENGNVQKLSDYVGKGDYVLADFWASWCGPCRAEIPNIKKIYDKYNGKGLTVIGIAVWDDPADTQRAIEELQIPWQQITNAGSVPTDLYGINGIPHIILFAPDGTIVARDLRGDDMIARVAEAMKKK